MMSDFKIIADQQGWTLATQVELLLEYIENQQSDEAFNDFISEKTNDLNTQEQLGLENALTDLAISSSKKLFKCSIGVYPSVDAENHIEEYTAYVADINCDDAIEEARHLCEQKYGEHHRGLAFAAIGQAIVVNSDTLEEVE